MNDVLYGWEANVPHIMRINLINVMDMNQNNHLPIVIRLLGAIGGFLGGCLIGTILIIIVIAVTDSTFGLNNIWPGPLTGGIVGAILGFCFPRIGKKLAEVLNGL